MDGPDPAPVGAALLDGQRSTRAARCLQSSVEGVPPAAASSGRHGFAGSGRIMEKFSSQSKGTILTKERIQGITCSDKFCLHAHDMMAERQQLVQLDAEAFPYMPRYFLQPVEGEVKNRHMHTSLGSACLDRTRNLLNNEEAICQIRFEQLKVTSFSNFTNLPSRMPNLVKRLIFIE